MRAYAHVYLYLLVVVGVVKGILIAYRTRGASKTATSRVAQKLYGQDTVSRGYRLRRRGLLEDVPHVRLIRGVLVLREKDAESVRQLLRNLDCEVHERRVDLTPEDQSRLTA
ncbi:MAG: hypothetical protein ACREA0_06890 [bacterium]